MATGNLQGLYDYYLANLDQAMQDLAFGRVAASGGYHELRAPYAIYSWEMCFHVQMLLADRPRRRPPVRPGARGLLHTVVNPFAAGTSEDPVWRFVPLQADSSDDLDETFLRLDPNQWDRNVSEWRDNPFQPHVVARARPSAYRRWAATTYVNAWIAYGDYYFRQNTLETLPSAIQCYVVASHVLGPRGQDIPARAAPSPRRTTRCSTPGTRYSNALVDLEIAFPYSSQTPLSRPARRCRLRTSSARPPRCTSASRPTPSWHRSERLSTTGCSRSGTVRTSTVSTRRCRCSRPESTPECWSRPPHKG
ncbi:hypothetical protein ACRAWF_07880 [Streptomyces sp. L7]